MPSTLIQSMGLFWRRDWVFWGGKNNAGSLLGYSASSKKSKVVDFREQVGIYVLYSDYEVVYVGQSGKGNQKMFWRLKQHTDDDLAERWDRFSWFGVLRVNSGSSKLQGGLGMVHPTIETVLNHVEGILIHSVEPPMNGQDGRFGTKVKRYLQERDNRIGPSSEKMLELLCDKNGIDLKSLKKCPN